MDLTASSRIITSALTSLEVPPHEFSSIKKDVQDEIHFDGGKDDKEASSAATQRQNSVGKDQQFANSMESNVTILSQTSSINHVQPSQNVDGSEPGLLTGETCPSQSGEIFNSTSSLRMSEENEDLVRGCLLVEDPPFGQEASELRGGGAP